MRVVTAALATETNTLAPMPTGVAAFRDCGYYTAIEVQACPAK